MKIVDVADFFSERGGGVRSYLTSLAGEGERRGHEVVIIAPGPRDEERAFNGGKLVRLAGPAMPYDPSYNLLWRVDRVLDVIARERPDVLQASSPYLPAPIVWSRKNVKIRSLVFHSDQVETYVRPLVERFHSRGLTRITRRATAAIHRGLTRRFDITVTPSRAIAEMLEEDGCTNVTAVPFGVEVSQLGPQHASEEIRRELLGSFAGVPNAAVAVASCRLAIEKRVARVIDAVEVVNRTRPLALAIFGDGPERARLEEQARKLPQVRFYGFLKERARYNSMLASADVFVHGGAAETFAFVLAEAMASGLPLVVADAGAAKDYYIEGLAETYPAYGTLDEMAASITRALAIPRDIRARMLEEAKAGRLPSGRLPFQTQSQHFDELFALYESMLDPSSVTGGPDVSRREASPATR